MDNTYDIARYWAESGFVYRAKHSKLRPITPVSFLIITGNESSQSEQRYLVHINKLNGSSIFGPDR